MTCVTPNPNTNPNHGPDPNHGPIPSVAALKAQAKRLRAALAGDGAPLSHARALETLARQYGFANWNTLRAMAEAAAPVGTTGLRLAPGDRVGGRYLGHPFEGRVVAARDIGAGRRLHLTVEFDEAVDVVAFDSFSSLRKRVTATLGPDGRSAARTSDGRPHMELSL